MQDPIPLRQRLIKRRLVQPRASAMRIGMQPSRSGSQCPGTRTSPETSNFDHLLPFRNLRLLLQRRLTNLLVSIDDLEPKLSA